MSTHLFIPSTLVGRQAEVAKICQILASDGDLLLAGVPGSGRRTLLRHAAQLMQCQMIEIDCLRATDSTRFLHLLAEGIMTTFSTPADLALVERICTASPLLLKPASPDVKHLLWPADADEWQVFQALLSLPQILAEARNSRVVIVFQNFPHLRSWDRKEKWQTYLRQEVHIQDRVSYALIATVAERWIQHSNMQVVFLGPLRDEEIVSWLIPMMAAEGLKFDSKGHALALFLDYVQGHFGDALALARRIWLTVRSEQAQLFPRPSRSNATQGQSLENAASFFLVHPYQVHRSALALVQDLSVTFESLILLLPPSQVRVLESLALDPTPSPQAREYIRKHRLSRGGGLQGALASLEQKGLVYGADYNYRLTIPLLALWLRHRLA